MRKEGRMKKKKKNAGLPANATPNKDPSFRLEPLERPRTKVVNNTVVVVRPHKHERTQFKRKGSRRTDLRGACTPCSLVCPTLCRHVWFVHAELTAFSITARHRNWIGVCTCMEEVLFMGAMWVKPTLGFGLMKRARKSGIWLDGRVDIEVEQGAFDKSILTQSMMGPPGVGSPWP